ncbi:MAG: hypothetical protein SNJ77_02220 [Cytophagales bacterium]
MLILVVSYLNVQKKDMYYLHHPDIIKLCEDQLVMADDIAESILNVLVYTGSRKDNEVSEVIHKMSIWKERQKDLAEAIKESEVDDEHKKLITEAFRNSNTFINNMNVSFQIVIQKSDVSGLSKHFHDLILKNENNYVLNVKKVIDIYRQIDESMVSSSKTKERLVFAFAIMLVLINLVILLSPIRKNIVGS